MRLNAQWHYRSPWPTSHNLQQSKVLHRFDSFQSDNHEEASVGAAIFKSPRQKSLQPKRSLKTRPNTRQIEQMLIKLRNYVM